MTKTDVDVFDFDEMILRNSEKPKPIQLPEFIVLYGQPGSGKSYMAGSAIDLKDVKKGLILDTEGSTTVITDQKFDIVRVDKYSRNKSDGTPDPHAKFKMFNQILFGTPDGSAVTEKGLFHTQNKTSYGVVIVDTLDKVQDWAIEYFQTEGAPISKSGEVDGYKVWALVGKWAAALADGMKSIAPLAIATVHDKEEKTSTGALTKRLELSGKAKNIVPGAADMVAYLERRKTPDGPVTTAYFSTEDNKVTKSRFEQYIPPVVEGATIPWIFSTIKEGHKNDAASRK